MKEEKNKVVKLVFGIFGGLGILFLMIGIVIALAVGKDDIDDFDTVRATIVDIERWGDGNHRVYVEYDYNGENYYWIKYNVYRSGMHRGQEIDVLVNKDNPEQFYNGNIGLILLLIFGGVGLTYALIGGIPLAIVFSKEKHKKYLLANGRALWGVVEEVDLNTHVSINHRHPYRFTVKYEDESIVTTSRIYNSGNVWFTTIQPQSLIGANAKVMVNPKNEADYVVDLDSIKW